MLKCYYSRGDYIIISLYTDRIVRRRRSKQNVLFVLIPWTLAEQYCYKNNIYLQYYNENIMCTILYKYYIDKIILRVEYRVWSEPRRYRF